MAGAVALASVGTPPAEVFLDDPLRALIEAIWDHEPTRVEWCGRRWRWKDHALSDPEVRGILGERMSSQRILIDPQRASCLGLPLTGPSSPPFEVTVYPVVVRDLRSKNLGRPGPETIYLCLFYSMTEEDSGPFSSNRERAYYRVVETLERMERALSGENPRRFVRAIDVPMPGWMRDELDASVPTSERRGPSEAGTS